MATRWVAWSRWLHNSTCKYKRHSRVICQVSSATNHPGDKVGLSLMHLKIFWTVCTGVLSLARVSKWGWTELKTGDKSWVAKRGCKHVWLEAAKFSTFPQYCLRHATPSTSFTSSWCWHWWGRCWPPNALFPSNWGPELSTPSWVAAALNSCWCN